MISDQSNRNNRCAVLFDMDGLMFDTERIGRVAWKQACREADYEMTDEVFDRIIATIPAECAEILTKHFGADFDYYARRARRIEIGREIEKTEGVGVKAGLLELLKYLQQHNVPCALASMTESKRARVRLQENGIEDYFALVLGGERIKKGKPEPEIFLTAAAELGVVPQHCMVLEDSRPGIAAASAAGMMPVMVPDLQQPDEAMSKACRLIAPSLVEVLEKMPELLAELQARP